MPDQIPGTALEFETQKVVVIMAPNVPAVYLWLEEVRAPVAHPDRIMVTRTFARAIIRYGNTGHIDYAGQGQVQYNGRDSVVSIMERKFRVQVQPNGDVAMKSLDIEG
ncbi:hypothetical protein HGA91_05525 [candidate division WWE3 bacterium]|nr:hypothetical protein [candidate division WWE3 bacterium]